MTRDEILAMEAGRELDILVAEKVFDWKDDGDACSQPEYSTDIAAAWEVVDRMRELGWHLDLRVIDGQWWSTFFKTPYHLADESRLVIEDSAPEAICKAALLAVKGDAK